MIVVVIFACGSNDPLEEEDNNTPDETTPETGLLYNGIELPSPWPPIRSATSELEAGMNPYYLANKPDVIDISTGRQLFVDDFLVEQTNLNREYHYPEYDQANPILAPDKEWENVGTMGAAFAAPFSDGVWYDEKDQKYKMWYMAGGKAYVEAGTGVTCYAESSDGINWIKPSLNIIPGTNIVDNTPNRDASVVWLDKQESNPAKRYKMFLVARSDGDWRYHYKTSSDGILWRQVETSKPIADRSTVFKNPFRDIWSYSIRHNIRVNSSKLVRARDYNEHQDPAEGTRKAEALVSSFWFGPWPNELRHPRYPEVDPAIYNHDAVPYESIMLGFFSVWQGPENDVADEAHELKRNQVMLGYSRDGYSWYRSDMNPFFAVNENSEAWNYGNLQSVAGSPLIVGDKLYFYLSGRRLTSSYQEITTTGLAMLRRDGFVSMCGTGELKTELLKYSGKYLYLNAKVQGTIKVELLDKNGNVIPGYSKVDCDPIVGDHTKSQVSWQSSQTLPSQEKDLIRIKFYMEEGELFSFWITPSSEGTSNGYTSGGGPTLNPLGVDVN
ncbi:hypothetical protein [Mangrovibacterium marinum]|nr:hypothetical protein [Mangrovibacterium marinum]